MKYKLFFFLKIIILLSNILLVIILLIKNKSKYLKLYKIPKISVFLPIYNKEKYLIESIDSIQKQTLKNIEIIAVNDGSTDKSLYILKKLAKKDTRIKIINNDRNHGLLYSRAMGILNSTGEYLMNLDPDDKYEGNDNLKDLYKILKQSNLNYITFLLKRIPSKQSEFKICELKNKMQLKYEHELITNKLIKKNLFLKVYKKFEKYIYSNKWNFYEDNIWHTIIHNFNKSNIKINKYIYLYKRNNESLMVNKTNIIEKKNRIYGFKMLLELSFLKIPKIYKRYLILLKKINYLLHIKIIYFFKNKLIIIINLLF